MSSNSNNMQDNRLILDEITDSDTLGKYIGQVKWFQDKRGYGFITICAGNEQDTDVFIHHSGIRPLNSMYKTLRKGEYVQFNLNKGDNGQNQAVDVTGINGGTLMCDVVPVKSPIHISPTATLVNPSSFSHAWMDASAGGHYLPAPFLSVSPPAPPPRHPVQRHVPISCAPVSCAPVSCAPVSCAHTMPAAMQPPSRRVLPIVPPPSASSVRA